MCLSMLAAQNLGLAVFIIVVDAIKEKYGYVYLEFTFLIVLYFTLLAGMYISIHLTIICRELVHLNFHEVDLLNSNSTIIIILYTPWPTGSVYQSLLSPFISTFTNCLLHV